MSHNHNKKSFRKYEKAATPIVSPTWRGVFIVRRNLKFHLLQHASQLHTSKVDVVP
jgi:hypothetical protein